MAEKIPENIRKQITKAVKILKQGGVVAFPTETVYGLAASMAVPDAAERIYRIKGRPNAKALLLLLSEFSQVDKVAGTLTPVALCLAQHFWPGPLTLIVNKSKEVPDVITSGKKTVAVRVTPHPIAIALIEALGSPITGTSANISGRKSPVTHEEVSEQLGSSVDLIIEGGRCPGGTESTIVDVTGEVPVVIREGAIPGAEILKYIAENCIKI